MPENKLLIIGDSHTIALKAGCDELGIPAAHLWFSGTFWHANQIVPNRKTGLWARPRAARVRIEKMLKANDIKNVYDLDLPILGSFGFNLGRLAGPIGWNGHTVYDEDTYSEDEPGLIASKQFLQDYIQNYASHSFKVAKSMRRKSKLLMVPPPVTRLNKNLRASHKTLVEMYRSKRTNVHDPSSYVVSQKTSVLLKNLTSGDGVHANREYGKRVVQRILDEGHLKI